MKEHIKFAFEGLKLLYKSNRRLFFKRLVITWAITSLIIGAFSYNTQHLGRPTLNILYLIGYGNWHAFLPILFFMVLGFVVYSMARGSMRDAKQKKEDGFSISKTDTTYGDARWATKREIREYVDVVTPENAQGTILGASRDEPNTVYSWKLGGDIGNGHMLCMAS